VGMSYLAAANNRVLRSLSLRLRCAARPQFLVRRRRTVCLSAEDLETCAHLKTADLHQSRETGRGCTHPLLLHLARHAQAWMTRACGRLLLALSLSTHSAKHRPV
jgi:hypothetical protein